MVLFPKRIHDQWQDWQQRISEWDPIQPARPCRQKVRFLRSRQIIFYTLSLGALLSVYGLPYYNEPHLTIGSLAPETLIAPAAATITDTLATEQLRRLAREQTTPIWQMDPEVNRSMKQELRSLLSQVNQIRQRAGVLPFISTERLTIPAQAYVRRLHPHEWQVFQQQLQELPRTPLTSSSLAELFRSLDPSPERRLTLQQLHTLWQQRQISSRYQDTVALVVAAQQRFQEAQTLVAQSGIPFTPALLDLSDEQWQRLTELLERAHERLIASGVTPGLPPALQRQGILSQFNDVRPSERFVATVQPTLAQWLDQTLRPNLLVDPVQTRVQMDVMAREVPAVVVSIAHQQILVRANEIITPETFLVLDHFQLTQRRVNFHSLIGLTILLSLALGGFRLIYPRLGVTLRNRDRLLLLLLSMTVPALAVPFGVAFSSLPAVALLVSSYYGRRVGLLVVAGQALLLPATLPLKLLTYVPLLVGSSVACGLAERLRSREELAILGGAAALVQVVIQGALSVVSGTGLDLAVLGLTGLTGLGWSIIALGASPYLERLFDLITPVRLLELANPNRPLLQQMAAQAPGTFQHTLFVTSLAERAAQKLKANAELVRAGTLYHDIGKMLHAEYFIENQMGRVNPHDQLDDPYRSTEIIKAHVTDGLKLAYKHQLPSAIRAFIPEHQGTICIAYFYHKAKSRQSDQPILEADFRYAGPIPQSRETGIVMLADACEAALRSIGSQDCLTEKVTAEARATVDRICRSRWQDGQLADSGLTLADLDSIREIFIQVWQQSHHERIRYPAPTEPDVTVGNTRLDLISPPTQTPVTAPSPIAGSC